MKFHIDECFGSGHAVLTNIAGKGELTTFEDVGGDLDVSHMKPKGYAVRQEMGGFTFVGRFVKM